METPFSLEVQFNSEKRLIKLTGIDALHKGSSSYISLADIAQIYYLFQEGKLPEIIKKGRVTFRVPNSENAINNLLQIPCVSPKSKRKGVPKRMRKQLWIDYHNDNINGICYCCGDKVSVFNWHASHVISLFEDGPTILSNLRVCCESCNGDMGVENLYDYIRRKDLQGPGKNNIPKDAVVEPLDAYDLPKKNYPAIRKKLPTINESVVPKLVGISRLHTFDLQVITINKLMVLTKDDLEDLVVSYGINPETIPFYKNKSTIVAAIYKAIMREKSHSKIIR